jgi:hypothetical protein
MGNSPASRLTSSWFGATATTLGAVGGNEKNALSATNQLPQFTPAGTISNGTFTVSTLMRDCCTTATGVPSTWALGPNTGTTTGQQNATLSGAMVFTGAAVGSASPSSFALVQPTILVTTYIKL